MSAFAGVIAFDDDRPNRRSDDGIVRALAVTRKVKIGTNRVEAAVFAQHATADVFSHRGDRFLFAALARLDNRQELGAALGVAPGELASLTDGEILLRMLQHRGAAGIARCLGAFAFALWDAKSRVLTLGRDCLGNRPLFYHRGATFVAFATSLRALLACPDVPREIDDLALARFMALDLSEGARTLYRGIERVPSRSLVTIDRAAARQQFYWAPDFAAPPPYRREDDYVERARELFDQAVAAVTRDLPHVAIAASGGLDSSAIAATVARLNAARSITCFTMVPPADTRIDVGPFRYLDEREKMAALARAYPQLDVRLIAAAAPHPFEEDCAPFFARANLPVLGPAAYGWYAHLDDAVARAGHRVLLVGHYGNFGLTWWGKFALLALLRAGAWREFARELRASAQHSGRSLARTFAGDVLLRGIPTAARRSVHRLQGRNPDSVAHYSALSPDFIAGHRLAREWRQRGFDPWFGGDAWHPAQYRFRMMFDHGQVIRDLAGAAGEVTGFEFRDPHGDRRLLEFALSVPEHLFNRKGVPRAFARNAFSDRLPAEILNERRRGAQVPDWFRRASARRHAIAAELERIESSALAGRLVDVPRLKQLMARWPKDEAAAETRADDFKLALLRGVHIGQFVRWVEGANS